MPYGRKAGAVRAYSYGCTAPTANRDAALAEMRRRNDLWNRLIEIDREARAAKDVFILPATEGIPDDREHYAERKAARKAAFAEHADEIKEIERVAYVASHAAYRSEASGLYWCNAEDVLIAWQNARRRKDPPKFHGWRGEGKLTVRWQQGLPVSALFDGHDLRCQIDPVAPIAWIGTRSERRHHNFTSLRLRIGSDGRKPLWLETTVYVHRPLPVDGTIRSASVIRRRVGNDDRWSLVLIVETADADPDAPVVEEHARPGRIALDIGWRLLPPPPDAWEQRPETPWTEVVAGMRIAAWHDHAGRQGTLVIPKRWLDEMARADEKRSFRDKSFDTMRAMLAAWLQIQTGVPDWLRDETVTLAQWRSIGRMVMLYRKWRENRIAGDDEIFAALATWHREEQHHYRFESNVREQLLLWRREQYRIFAVWVAKNYGEVIIEEFDLSDVAGPEYWIPKEIIQEYKGSSDKNWKDALRIDLVTEPERFAVYQAHEGTTRPKGATRFFGLDAKARHQRFVAGCSYLRLALANAVTREGGTIITHPATNTTRHCHVCGHVEPERVAELVHCCSQCGAEWDQDHNAAINLFSQIPPVLAGKGI
ncbi:MAG: transposase [Patescibacteria group bacterium]|nr:transposase [Patescibacteria group bacterium]